MVPQDACFERSLVIPAHPMCFRARWYDETNKIARSHEANRKSPSHGRTDGFEWHVNCRYNVPSFTHLRARNIDRGGWSERRRHAAPSSNPALDFLGNGVTGNGYILSRGRDALSDDGAPLSRDTIHHMSSDVNFCMSCLDRHTGFVLNTQVA